jgi:hypothetical protein
MSCCNNKIFLGCFNACNNITLPIISTYTGVAVLKWTAHRTFVVNLNVVQGENIIIPAGQLNESAKISFTLEQPNGDPITYIPNNSDDPIEYDCFTIETSIQYGTQASAPVPLATFVNSFNGRTGDITFLCSDIPNNCGIIYQGDNITLLTNNAGYVNAAQASAAAPIQTVTGTQVTGTSSSPIINFPNWNQITGNQALVNISGFNNNAGYVNASQAANAAPIQSVTGTQVTGTSSDPIINFPTWGQITGSQNVINVSGFNNDSGYVNAAQAAAAAPVQSVTGNIVSGTLTNPVVTSPVPLTGNSVGDILQWNGTAWVKTTVANGEILKNTGAGLAPISHTTALQNKVPFERSPLGFVFPPKQIIAWDHIDRVNEFPITSPTDSGNPYLPFKTLNSFLVVSKALRGIMNNTDNDRLINISPTKNIGIHFSTARSTFGGTNSGLMIIRDNDNYFFFGRRLIGGTGYGGQIPSSSDYHLYAVIGGVSTLLGTITQNSIYAGGINDGFNQSRITFEIRYGNRGRNDASRFFIKCIERPSLIIEADVTAYNSVFDTPANYAKIGFYLDAQGIIYSYCVADLNL